MSHQSADSKRFIARKWVASFVLILGLATAWGIVALLTGSIIGTLMPRGPWPQESVLVAVDGTPLIRSYFASNYYNIELRTLDGQMVELDHQDSWLDSTVFGAPYRKPRLLKLPIPWRERIAGCSDLAKPPANWFLMRNDHRPGSAYFAGYDTNSKLGLGFIGRQGFRSTVPPAEEQFDLGNQTFGWGKGAAASSAYLNFGGPPNHYQRAFPVKNQLLAPWLVFLLDGNSIHEIDLRSHKIRTLGKLDQLLALGVVSQPQSVADEAAEKQEDSDKKTHRSLPKFRLAAMQNGVIFTPDPLVINTKHKTVHRLLARCSDRIVAINPFEGSQQEFSLPERLQQKMFTAHLIASDQLLLQVQQGVWEQGSVVDLLWIKPSGEVNRQETFRLKGYVPPNPHKQLLQGAAVMPSLLPWAIGTTIVAPLMAVHTHKADSFLHGLIQTLAEVWSMLVLILGLSIVLTLLVRRWQKQYCRDNTLLWCATVFATTVPGLLAYWLMHRETVVEPCLECGQLAPRDRDACAHCEKPFAAPALRGTEILT